MSSSIVVIRDWGEISPLGSSKDEIAGNLFSGKTFIKKFTARDETVAGAPAGESGEEKLTQIKGERRTYRKLDRSVLLALHSARQALNVPGSYKPRELVINIGSSRGATELFERYHKDFLLRDKLKTTVHTSPTTTLGNISSWVMEDAGLEGTAISHSMTCSTTLQAFANGMAWIRSGMAQQFPAGGAEAPLTPFTLAQFTSLGLSAPADQQQYPCRPLNKQENTLVPGGELLHFYWKRRT